MALDWRFSQRMAKTFLADLPNRRDAILFRTLNGKWAWAIRQDGSHLQILASGEHRNRIQAARQAEIAAQSVA